MFDLKELKKDFKSQKLINNLKALFDEDDKINIRYLKLSQQYIKCYLTYIYKRTKVVIRINKNLNYMIIMPFFDNDKYKTNCWCTNKINDLDTYNTLYEVIKNINKTIDEITISYSVREELNPKLKRRLIKYLILDITPGLMLLSLFIMCIIFIAFGLANGNILHYLLFIGGSAYFIITITYKIICFTIDMINNDLVSKEAKCSQMSNRNFKIVLYFLINNKSKKFRCYNYHQFIGIPMFVSNDKYYKFFYLKRSRIIVNVESRLLIDMEKDFEDEEIE